MSFIDDMTDFIFIEDEPEASDIIFIPGNGYSAVAHTAAGLWHKGLAPYILPSGKYSKLAGRFISEENPKLRYESEFAFFEALLKADGVDENAIFREDQATFTYENAIYSRKVTDAAGICVKKAILCCQAYHARRCLLYYKIMFPETRFYVCPTVTRGVSKKSWYKDKVQIDLVLGEIEKCGSQFHQIVHEFGAGQYAETEDSLFEAAKRSLWN